MRNRFILGAVMCLLVCCNLLAQQKDDLDYQSWLKQYDSAKTTQAAWRGVSFVGFLAAGACTLGYLSDQPEEGCCCTKKKSGYLIGAAASAAIAVTGVIVAVWAGGTVRELEAEGQRKDYLEAALVPTIGGYMVRISYKF